MKNYTDLYVVVSGKSPLPDPDLSKDLWFFSLEEAFELKDHYERTLKDQIRETVDGKKREAFMYLLQTLRVEKAVVH